MLRLEPIDQELLRLTETPAELARTLGARLEPVTDIVAAIVAQNVAHQGADRPRDWGGFLAIDEVRGQVVGSCAFVHPPDGAGAVEIAYFTFPPFEGSGVATMMAAALIQRASAAGGVRTVFAHTLPEMNASAKVLIRNGFVQSGWAMDDQAGEVWRWDRSLEDQKH